MREKLIKILIEYYTNKYEGFEEAADRIEALYSDKWISVEERLPEMRCRHYLVLFPMGEERVAERYFDGDGRFYNTDSDMDITDFITHWQPLPSPPKSKQ